MDSLQLAWDHFISTAILLAGQISSISSSRAVATIVVGLLLLRRAHRALTQTCLNNWTSNRPFDPYREIALVTGGCGGIGACIAADLAQRGVTVIVVDIVKPESELRNTHLPLPLRCSS